MNRKFKFPKRIKQIFVSRHEICNVFFDKKYERFRVISVLIKKFNQNKEVHNQVYLLK